MTPPESPSRKDQPGAAPGAASGPERTGESGRTGAGSPLEVFAVTLRLGLTSFGGPIAHLGYFHREYVVRRRWLDEQSYADLVALCQFLPGPASSELGIAIGMRRAGLLGGLAAWLGFTLPSAVALTAFALLLRGSSAAGTAWIHGLQLVAVPVVALAIWTMGQRLITDRTRATIAAAAAVVLLAWPLPVTQVLVILAAGLAGWRLLPVDGNVPALSEADSLLVSRRVAIAAWVILLALLAGLPIARHLTASHAVAVADTFFRTGALVFGGGHVVLPLLQAAVVPPGWVGTHQFLAGYGAAQAVPGPLFTFAAYLGAIEGPAPHGVTGAALALGAIFLPAFLLVTGALPFWSILRHRHGIRAALAGVNAAVVGFLVAALYHPIWTSSVRSSTDVIIVLIGFNLLAWWRSPPWLVVAVTVGLSVFVSRLS